jgi:uncharacterized OB-fold protein
MNEPPAKPAPLPTALSQPYWDGIAAQELRLQRCSACGTFRHYPRLLCSRCYSDAVSWVTASGRGTVHSWTVAHHPYHPAFVVEVPYTLALVDLAEGPRAMGRWQGETPIMGQTVVGRVVAREGGADLVFSAA